MAFISPEEGTFLFYWDWVVEVMFYTDLILNFFQEFEDPDTHQGIRNMKQIALHYCYGWFSIDFVSVFPFDALFGSGKFTKLFRLFRLPRLLKLLDISRFKKIIKGSKGKDDFNEAAIINQYFILYMYNMIRLVIIALFITYFIGCIFFFISDKMNNEEDVKISNTFLLTNSLESDDCDLVKT